MKIFAGLIFPEGVRLRGESRQKSGGKNIHCRSEIIDLIRKARRHNPFRQAQSPGWTVEVGLSYAGKPKSPAICSFP